MLFIQTQSIILEHMLQLLLHFLFLILAQFFIFSVVVILRGSVTFERGLSLSLAVVVVEKKFKCTRQKESKETWK